MVPSHLNFLFDFPISRPLKPKFANCLPNEVVEAEDGKQVLVSWHRHEGTFTVRSGSAEASVTLIEVYAGRLTCYQEKNHHRHEIKA
jgi:hypothetical protein